MVYLVYLFIYISVYVFMLLYHGRYAVHIIVYQLYHFFCFPIMSLS